MASVKICDRCNVMIKRNKFDDCPDIHLQVRDITGDYGTMMKDLCDDCMIAYNKMVVDFFGNVEVVAKED